MKLLRLSLLLGFASALLTMPSCAMQSATSKDMNFVKGSYEFKAKSIDRSQNYCLYSGVATIESKEPENEKILVINADCRQLSKAVNPIFVDSNVGLSAKDYRAILLLLEEHNKNICDKTKGAAILMCFKNESPNFVSFENGKYIFWYRRALNPGDVGIGVNVIKKGNKFVVMH
jgi:hypothetical protein